MNARLNEAALSGIEECALAGRFWLSLQEKQENGTLTI
jgi:hypothetical protein